MNHPDVFSVDYVAARERFRRASSRLGWQLESHPIEARGPDNGDLTIDVAASTAQQSIGTLVVSSGLHGVEGFFGSAVQVSLLEQWATGSWSLPPVKCVFIHALNPYGFAWLRRCNEGNIDLNRNFLLPGEAYQGSPAGYADLDPLLNPKCPPSNFDLFLVKAAWVIARKGMPALRQAVAGGQYDFPKGIFFGGSGPSPTYRFLTDHLHGWLAGSRNVIHLDLHTGLGRSGTYKLLIDYPLTQVQREKLQQCFGKESFEESASSSIAYDVRGGLGRWCLANKFADEYLFACAEFGTYGALTVLAGLRAENQAHHWGSSDDNSWHRYRYRLKELFCPSSSSWRTQVLARSFELVEQAVTGLRG